RLVCGDPLPASSHLDAEEVPELHLGHVVADVLVVQEGRVLLLGVAGNSVHVGLWCERRGQLLVSNRLEKRRRRKTRRKEKKKEGRKEMGGEWKLTILTPFSEGWTTSGSIQSRGPVLPTPQVDIIPPLVAVSPAL